MNEASPLGVYIHWPYCARICPYCDFNVVRDRGRTAEQAELAAAIIADLEAQRRLTGPRSLVSVFFGGGTPSLMAPDQVSAVLSAAKALWTATPDLEVSLEANPTDAEAERFSDLAGAGVGRLSLGLQSLDDAALHFLGRDHDAAAGRRAAARARAAFPRLSLDLIYALPGQSPEAWATELAAAADLGAEHLSPYQLTLEPGTAMTRAAARGRFKPVDEDLAASLFETTQSVLEARGFTAYEVSNHARGPAAEARHNLVYWRGEDYVGAGPGAHGRLTLQGRRQATTAERDVKGYIAKVEREGVGFADSETLSALETAQERILMGLRTLEGVSLADLSRLGFTPDGAKVAALQQDGLLDGASDRLIATAAGRMVLDRLTAELALAG